MGIVSRKKTLKKIKAFKSAEVGRVLCLKAGLYSQDHVVWCLKKQIDFQAFKSVLVGIVLTKSSKHNK